MKVKFKYITFVRASKQNPKTWIYIVRENPNHRLLGLIQWFARWRQYGFYPEEGTVFEKTCLQDITNFCIKLNEKQKIRSKKK